MIRVEYNGQSTNVSKVYAEYNGTSTEVISAYAEVNGVSELVYSSVPILPFNQHRKTADDLITAKNFIGAGSTNKYAFMVCGVNTSGSGAATTSVDAYNVDGVRTTATNYTWASCKNDCISNGTTSNKLLVAHGGDATGLTGNFYVKAYSNSLAISNAPVLKKIAVERSVFNINGNSYFAGGRNNNTYIDTCECYNTSTVKSVLQSMSKPRSMAASAATDEFGAIIAGYNGSSTRPTDADIYNKSNVQTLINLSVARTRGMAARLGDGIVVAGGSDGSVNATTLIEYINKDKIVIEVGNLNFQSYFGKAVGSDNLAAFFDMSTYINGTVSRTKEVEYITKDFLVALSQPTRDFHYEGGVTQIGNRVFVGGGSTSPSEKTATVEMYDITI